MLTGGGGGISCSSWIDWFSAAKGAAESPLLGSEIRLDGVTDTYGKIKTSSEHMIRARN